MHAIELGYDVFTVTGELLREFNDLLSHDPTGAQRCEHGDANDSDDRRYATEPPTLQSNGYGSQNEAEK